MAEPRPKPWRDGLTPRMRALKLQVEKEAKAEAEADVHAVRDGRVLPRRRFEVVGGDDHYAYFDRAADVCREACKALRRAERTGKLVWLATIQTYPVEGLPHPVWLMDSKLMAAPKGYRLDHGDAAGASPADEPWLYLVGFRPAGGAPVKRASLYRPPDYIETEVDGVLMALPIEAERPDLSTGPLKTSDDD